MDNKEKLDELREEQDRWEETTLQKTLNRFPERHDTFITTSSAPVERLYTPLDIADLDYERDLSFPGQYPFTRGVHPTMHRGRLWTMRMFAGFGTAEETNERFREILAAGGDGLSTAFDMPTLMGLDSD
ncbi:MAG: methylmalonyl-CoA mutase family protein, partial [Anaerolineae bacterium]